MTIEEKPKALEFTFSIEGNPNLKYEIVYDSQKSQEPIIINYGGLKMGMPVELFTEVVDFLTSKGVIISKGKIIAGQINTETIINTIPLPVIDGEENEIEKVEQITTGPVTSFDTSVETEEIIKEIVEEKNPEKEKNIVIKENKKEETISNRIVIKTKKFNKDDPKGAEREAAELRGSKESNFKRT